MTIEEIENTLINGFHDAQLIKIDINYVRRKALLDFQVDMSCPGSIDDESEGFSRPGRLILSEVLFLVIEPPDPQYPYQRPEGQWISDSGLADSAKLSNTLLKSLPEKAFVYYFFMSDWNSFIYLAAMDASFEWI